MPDARRPEPRTQQVVDLGGDGCGKEQLASVGAQQFEDRQSSNSSSGISEIGRGSSSIRANPAASAKSPAPVPAGT
jgi:hypothetical protein